MGILTSPMDQEVLADTATAGLGSSGWDAPSSAATLPALSNAQRTTVRLSADESLPDNSRRQGLSGENRIERPRAKREEASDRSMRAPNRRII